MEFSFNSVEYLPEAKAKAAFTTDSTKVFRDAIFDELDSAKSVEKKFEQRGITPLDI